VLGLRLAGRRPGAGTLMLVASGSEEERGVPSGMEFHCAVSVIMDWWGLELGKPPTRPQLDSFGMLRSPPTGIG